MSFVTLGSTWEEGTFLAVRSTRMAKRHVPSPPPSFLCSMAPKSSSDPHHLELSTPLPLALTHFPFSIFLRPSVGTLILRFLSLFVLPPSHGKRFADGRERGKSTRYPALTDIHLFPLNFDPGHEDGEEKQWGKQAHINFDTSCTQTRSFVQRGKKEVRH